MKRPISIRKIGLLYAGATALIIALAASAVFMEVRGAMRAQQTETVLRALDGKTQTLIQALKVYERAAARVAADPTVLALLAIKDANALTAQAIEARRSLPDVIRVGFCTPSGEYLGDRSGPSAQCHDDLQRDARAKLLALPVHRNDLDGGHFDIYAPAQDKSGTPIGYVFLSVRLAVLSNMLRAIGSRAEAIVLHDSAGEPLASSGDPAGYPSPLRAKLPVADTSWTLELIQKNPTLSELERAFVVGATLATLACAGLAVLLTMLGTRQLRHELDAVHTAMQHVAEGEAPQFGVGTCFAELRAIMDATENIAGRIHAHQQTLTELSLTDELTQLPNRRFYMQELARAVNFARRGMPVCVGILDLDYFKEVNDHAGHDAGDAVLKLAARVLNQNLRAADFASRLGGDEFAIVLLGMSYEDARDWFDRIRTAFHHEYDNAGIAEVPCSLSAGFTFIDPVNDDAISILAHADAALYEAKREGRNRVIGKIA